MSDLLELLTTQHFTVGIWVGVGLAVLGLAIALSVPASSKPVPIGGLLVTGGLILTILAVPDTDGSALLPLLLVVLGVAVGRRLSDAAMAAPIAALPGAFWLGGALPDAMPLWLTTLVVLLIPMAGFAISEFDQRYRGSGLGLIYLGIAVFGLFAAVPDTELPLALLSVTAPIVLLAWPRALVRIGPEGAYVVAGAFAWATAIGGQPRVASVVGGVGCLGLLLVEPALAHGEQISQRWFGDRLATPLGVVVATLPQLALTYLSSRVAARFESLGPALGVLALAYGIAVVVALQTRSSPAEGA